jgi:hypothetical protein
MAVFILDMSEIIYDFSPYRCDMVMHGPKPMLQFMERFTTQDIIEATMIHPAYRLCDDSIIWEVIEHQFPEGTGEFGEDPESLALFDFVAGAIQERADQLLMEKMREYNCEDRYEFMAFENWIGHSTAVFRDIHED